MISVCLAEMFLKFLERYLEELDAIIAKDENFKSSAKAATFDFGLTSLESSEVLTGSYRFRRWWGGQVIASQFYVSGVLGPNPRFPSRNGGVFAG